MVRFLFISFCALALVSSVSAQVPGRMATARGRSGQFLVRTIFQKQTLGKAKAWESVTVPVTTNSWAFLLNPGPGPSGDAAEADLEPASLAVSCERMKDALLFELGMSDQWRGQIGVRINGALPENEEPALTAILNRDGWSYELEVPSRLKSTQLYRALVHVLFLEIVNRKAGNEARQIPLWLVEGMTSELQFSTVPTFKVQPKARTLGNRFELVGLDSVRKRLREQTPLTFQDLSWPELAKISGETLKLYQACSQLFVHELFRLKDGRACLQQMLEAMPQFANWQLAFLRGFHPHFERLLDVEKWWALTCVAFTGRAATQVWTREESWQKLRETLDVPVQIHLDPQRLPTDAMITLQEVITQWEPDKQMPALQKTANQLLIMRTRITPELVPLADRYRAVLENYLGNRPSSRKHFESKHENASASLAARKKSTCKELTTLDSQRAALRSKLLGGRREAELSALEATSTTAAANNTPKH